MYEIDGRLIEFIPIGIGIGIAIAIGIVIAWREVQVRSKIAS